MLFKVLVFAMLSSASGWGLPSNDSLLLSNESTNIMGGVDSARDRRHLESCDRGAWVAHGDYCCDGLTGVGRRFFCSEACSCDEDCRWPWLAPNGLARCDSSCDKGCVFYDYTP